VNTHHALVVATRASASAHFDVACLKLSECRDSPVQRKFTRRAQGTSQHKHAEGTAQVAGGFTVS